MSYLPRLNKTFSEMTFSSEEKSRYGRHLILPDVGEEGQQKLKAARVLMVGAGGLGCPALTYLTAAGVGKIGIVDFDEVTLSNLQRQFLHKTSGINQAKVDSAAEALKVINPHVEIETFNTRLTSQNALEILAPFDVVIDGSDNFPTRYLMNDACVLLKKPLVYGALYRFEGTATIFLAEKGPCYRCFLPEPPPPESVPNCAEAGVLGVLPGVVGAIQATEAIKLILGRGDTLVGRMLFFDALKMKFRDILLRKDPQCPICGKNPTILRLIDYEHFCGAKLTSPKKEAMSNEVTVHDLQKALEQKIDFDLIDVREPNEYEVARIEGSRLMPLSQLPQRIQEIDPAREIWVHCKSGMRSAKAMQLLQKSGFSRVKNVKGGIEAWSREIDSKVPLY